MVENHKQKLQIAHVVDFYFSTRQTNGQDESHLVQIEPRVHFGQQLRFVYASVVFNVRNGRAERQRPDHLATVDLGYVVTSTRAHIRLDGVQADVVVAFFGVYVVRFAELV
jgi:hypothetical protein